MASAVYTKLPNRSVIAVAGDDRHHFLQGLITQDIDLLKSKKLIYSCLLTPNGKFLFDFFIYEDGEQLAIDCEGGERANSLLKRLSMFKLRSDVTLELHDNADVFQIFQGHIDYGFKDPRLDGHRVHSTPPNIDEVDFDVWDKYRIRNEIPDGSRDTIPEKSFIHESDTLIKTAVSYDKGCYMGQELVSRMHHRGLVKKQLRCVEINSIPENTELRSQCGDTGLALIKLE